MRKHPELTCRRIQHFLETKIIPALWEKRHPMQAAVYRPDLAPRDYHNLTINPLEAQQAEYAPVQPGYNWGPVWTDAWFRLSVTVPLEWKGCAVVAQIDTGSEGIVWDGDNPLQGIDWAHSELSLSPRVRGGEIFTLFVQSTGMNPEVSVNGEPKIPSPTPFTFTKADLAVYDPVLFGLYFDFNIAYQVMLELPDDSPRYGQLLYALNETINLYGDGDTSSIEAARRRLAETYQRPAVSTPHQVSAVGHAHIDSAWLWPLERTQYKCIHTFSTAVRFMDQYRNYKFLCSQPAQYEWVKNMAPKLYDRMKEKVASNQWEVTGSMWVEADCNIPSGESLIRQLIIGKNFFLDEFGIETTDLWLPDVFGYSAALPQILKKAGIDHFLTQKISWNQFNKFPHHTFLWQGIDGTTIFTHFPPADTYNGQMSPKELAYSVRNFKEHDRATRSLYIYGHGDGGGGPTIEMLENAERLANIEGMPAVTLEKASDFFKQTMDEAKDLPLWVGELYLELHRGSYTTQARNKRGNRKSEAALRDAEFLSVAAPNTLASYPSEVLARAWKTTLLNQFHDIIPGSSIQEVYRDSAKDYEEIARITCDVITDKLDKIINALDTVGMKRPVIVVSNLSHFANEVVRVQLEPRERPVTATGPEGEQEPVQIETLADGSRIAMFTARNVPMHGYAVWDLATTSIPPEPEDTVTVSANSLENGLLRVEFDETTGLITSIYDKECERNVLETARTSNGELLPEKCANQLQMFEDDPLFWDAWDVDLYYQDQCQILTVLESMEVVEWGPVRGAIRIVRTFGNSRIEQTIRLSTESRRIDFVTTVDWHESHKLLKAAFPAAINSQRATFEIQYGHVERPTHFNTSWDLARFEVCAQRWADISEGDYGVALLNDCKYGYDVHGNVLRLTLLRSTKAPDPEADMGLHHFTYSLLSHAGDLREGEVVENACALNYPHAVAPVKSNSKGTLTPSRSYFEVDNASIFIEAIKKAEREEAVIVRLYEAHNTRGTTRFLTTLPIRKAYICDLMEANLQELKVVEGEFELEVKPFEIITLKLILK